MMITSIGSYQITESQDVMRALDAVCALVVARFERRYLSCEQVEGSVQGWMMLAGMELLK